MVKLVYCVRRRGDMPLAEFHRYWHESHGPLVKKFAKAIRAKKYVQSHTIDTELNVRFVESRGLGEAYDGITEVWWDRLEDLTEAMNAPEGQAALTQLIDDERHFIDFPGSKVFMTEEREIF